MPPTISDPPRALSQRALSDIFPGSPVLHIMPDQLGHLGQAGGGGGEGEGARAEYRLIDVEGEDQYGRRAKLGTVAVVPVFGPITKRPRWSWGLANLCEIDAHLRDAAADPSIDLIVLEFHTPGGGVVGLRETADLIAAIDRDDKPVVGYTDTLCASAGMYLASACREFRAAGSSIVGSLGTIWGMFDVSKAYAEWGIEPVIARSGRYKGFGFPGKEITAEERAWMQGEVNKSWAEFQEQLQAGRGDIPAEAKEGQVITASEALGYNLLDALAPDLGAYLTDLIQPAGSAA